MYMLHGNGRQRSETRIAEVFAEMSVDIVALQELDQGDDVPPRGSD